MEADWAGGILPITNPITGEMILSFPLLIIIQNGCSGKIGVP